MVDSETLAARMRAAYVGDDAIAFDELKPEVRARWERVAAVGRVPFSDAQIERMAKAADECYSESWGTTWLDAILTALRPWLREPTGWELDVTEDEAFAAWRQHESPDYKLSMQAVLDLCRSRIRPTFECKECASGEDSWYRVSAAVDGIQAAVTAARAALEGE